MRHKFFSCVTTKSLQGDLLMTNTKNTSVTTLKQLNKDEYFMLDYFDRKQTRWVRSGFLTEKQIMFFMNVNGISDWERIRIQRETELDEMVDENGKTKMGTHPSFQKDWVGLGTKGSSYLGRFIKVSQKTFMKENAHPTMGHQVFSKMMSKMLRNP